MKQSLLQCVPETPMLRPDGTNKNTCALSPVSSVAKRNREKGAGHMKAIVWTMILVAFIYVTAMTIPVLINEYQFQDSLDQIARFSSVGHKSSTEVQKAVLDEAQKEDLPIQAEDIKVEGAGGNIHINVDYSVTVDLKVYQWTLNFHPAASNSAIL
jgi:hypothetical protein